MEPRTEQARIPILMYHEIYSEDETRAGVQDMHHSYYVSAKNFTTHLDIIKELGRMTVPLDLLHNKSDKGLKKEPLPLVVSFDDGHVGNYEIAFPLLAAKDMTGVFFCATSLIGKEKMLSWRQIREMSDSGMSIQSHSVSHLPLASLNKEEITYELQASKEILEDKTGKPVSFLSLPHGSYNTFTLTAAKKSGYKSICTSIFGYNSGTEYCLNRILLSSGYSMEDFRDIVTTAYSFQAMRMKQKMKYTVRELIGHRNYLRLYHLVNKIKQ